MTAGEFEKRPFACCYQRNFSLSLQTGKPWMIERSEFIESVEDWYHSPLASPNDGLLCAFVTLRLMTSEVFELLRPHQQPHHIRQLYHVEALLKIINSKVEKWQAHWLSSMEAGMKMWILSTAEALLKNFIRPRPVSPISHPVLWHTHSIATLLNSSPCVIEFIRWRNID